MIPEVLTPKNLYTSTLRHGKSENDIEQICCSQKYCCSLLKKLMIFLPKWPISWEPEHSCLFEAGCYAPKTHTCDDESHTSSWHDFLVMYEYVRAANVPETGFYWKRLYSQCFFEFYVSLQYFGFASMSPRRTGEISRVRISRYLLLVFKYWY